MERIPKRLQSQAEVSARYFYYNRLQDSTRRWVDLEDLQQECYLSALRARRSHDGFKKDRKQKDTAYQDGRANCETYMRSAMVRGLLTFVWVQSMKKRRGRVRTLLDKDEHSSVAQRRSSVYCAPINSRTGVEEVEVKLFLESDSWSAKTRCLAQAILEFPNREDFTTTPYYLPSRLRRLAGLSRREYEEAIEELCSGTRKEANR